MSNEYWLSKLTDLNKAAGNAPFKPLLLLVFLDLVEDGEFVGGNFRITPELVFRFDCYFDVVKHRRTAGRDRVRMPFHHLSTQKFWAARTVTGDTSRDLATTAYVIPDPEFLTACSDPEFRRQARVVLIETHFEPAERNALYHLVGIDVPQEDEAARGAFFQRADDAETAGRSARFRLDVVSSYRYTCALTGYRVTTLTGQAIVDAAHIHQFSDSRNNDPRNGIALCKNAHWQFDEGLWTIDDDYRIVVATEAFSESSPNQMPLASLNGRRLLLPIDETVWPKKDYLTWHRENKFQQFESIPGPMPT